VQAILGHSTITTTERYAHLAPGYAQAEIDRTKLDLKRGAVIPLDATANGCSLVTKERDKVADEV
jgi:hypothetical protein